MLWIDQKYISLISFRLEKFKKRNNAYNFRCPVCNDSKTNKNKARGYLLERGGSYNFYCHNCGGEDYRSFPKFLRFLDLSLYNEYTKEKLTAGANTVLAQKTVYSDSADENVLAGLEKVSQLDPNHFCKKFVVSRMIPNEFHTKLYYAPKFKSYINRVIPNKFENLKYDNPRIVIPFYDAQGKIMGVQGRALTEDNVRYMLIMFNDHASRVYGLERVNLNKKFYIVEGPFDSMFLENCLATGGSDLQSAYVRTGAARETGTLVFDNEPRNPYIIKYMNRAIKNGYNVCIWPSDIEQKDINDMVLSGLSPSEIQFIIDKNTYSGLSAELVLAGWKKI